MKIKENKNTILIVDDVGYNVKVLANALKDEYRVKVANNGYKALEIAASEDDPPDLILLDVIMPEMDGYEVCRLLKNNPRTQKIPVIFVTARDEADDEERGLNLGAVDYVTKPFHKAILKARVHNHVSLKIKTDLLENLAVMDGLTHIPNRRSFDQDIDKEWARALREKSSIAIVIMDIDHFKAYNDHYGHGKGDVCLTRVAEALVQSVERPADMVARYGGEEFVALLPNTDPEGAYKKGEEFRKKVEDLHLDHEFSNVGKYVTISVGVAAQIPQSGDRAETLLERADKALYVAKNEGRNQVSSGTRA